MPKTLVLYVYHEWNSRVDHFIKYAIFKDEDTDFIFIQNNSEPNPNPQLSTLPQYVKTLYRENKGYDFGGWSEALLQNDDYKNYDYFIFANSSIIGPCLPSYYKGKWTDIYINGLDNDKNIKLFGSTINSMDTPRTHSHIQSYIFAMNRETLDYLIETEIFSNTNHPTCLWDTVVEKEIKMSQTIIQNGWNIGCLHQYYKDVDFTFKTKSPEEYEKPFMNDIMFPSQRNVLWTDVELVFIKGNR